jgi:putative DNA primase/helicase
VSDRVILMEAELWAQDGFWPIPLKPNSKKPIGNKWTQLRLKPDELPEHFSNGNNLGVLTGVGPRHLADVDCDAREALACARLIQGPPTHRIFGRPGKPCSHYLYLVGAEFKTIAFKDPLQENREDKGMLIELRGVGGQTVMPGSVHEGTGELIAWSEKKEFGQPDFDFLKEWVSKVAAAALLARYWPKPGGRHEPVLALAGWCAFNQWLPMTALEFILAAAKAANDGKLKDREVEIQTTFDKFLAGDHRVTGRRQLQDAFDPKIIRKVASWLGFDLRPTNIDDLFKDSGNADYFLKMFPETRYCAMVDQFLYEKDSRWHLDRTNMTYARAETSMRVRNVEVAISGNKNDMLESARCLTNARYNALLNVLQGRQEIAIRPEEFDDHPMLLGVENGVLDLEKGELTEVDDAIVARTATVRFVKDAKPTDAFFKYLEKVQPLEANRKLLQQIAGICLTGRLTEPCIFLLLGNGANGKSVFVVCLRQLLGADYSRTAKRTLVFTPTHGERDAGDNDRSDLFRIRLATVSEKEHVARGEGFNTEFLKDITGSEPVQGKALYKDAINFVGEATWLVSCNKKPPLERVDEAWRRRFCLVPWDVTIPPEERIHPVERYISEYLFVCDGKAGFLNWALEGLKEVIDRGWQIALPATVAKSTEEYLSTADRVKMFFKECTVENADGKVSTNKLRLHYLAHRDIRKKEQFITQKKFTIECVRVFGEERCKKGTDNKMFVFGIELKEEAEQELQEWETLMRGREM